MRTTSGAPEDVRLETNSLVSTDMSRDLKLERKLGLITKRLVMSQQLATIIKIKLILTCRLVIS